MCASKQRRVRQRHTTGGRAGGGGSPVLVTAVNNMSAIHVQCNTHVLVCTVQYSPIHREWKAGNQES